MSFTIAISSLLRTEFLRLNKVLQQLLYYKYTI